MVASNVRVERGSRPRSGRKRSTPLELQGAVVFQNKNCRKCHALDGVGGRRSRLVAGGDRLTGISSLTGQQRYAGR